MLVHTLSHLIHIITLGYSCLHLAWRNLLKVTPSDSGQVNTSKVKASEDKSSVILTSLHSLFFSEISQNLLVGSCHLLSPLSRNHEIRSESQSCPWCHWELKSFHRIYTSIKLDSSRALWAISISPMNTCSSLHCRYYSPEFFFCFIQKSLHTFILLRTRFSANPSETYNICMWILFWK